MSKQPQIYRFSPTFPRFFYCVFITYYNQFNDLLQLDELQRIINVGSQSENI